MDRNAMNATNTSNLTRIVEKLIDVSCVI